MRRKNRAKLDAGSVAVGVLGGVALAAAAKAFMGMSPETQREVLQTIVAAFPKRKPLLPSSETIIAAAKVDDYCRHPLVERGLCCSRRFGHAPPCSASLVE